MISSKIGTIKTCAHIEGFWQCQSQDLIVANGSFHLSPPNLSEFNARSPSFTSVKSMNANGDATISISLDYNPNRYDNDAYNKRIYKQ